MGQEAECECEWNGSRIRVKAFIEPPELILRGGIRRRLPLSRIEQIRAKGDALLFTSQGESFALALGSALAQKWAKSLATPPPSLAKKLGIAEASIVRMIGPVHDEPLRTALSAAKAVAAEGANL